MHENSYNISIGIPYKKRPLGRPRHSWDNIKMYLKQIWCEDVDWIHLAQNRDEWWVLVNMVIKLQVP